MEENGDGNDTVANRNVGISWRNRIGFWMQRDRPNDVSREQITTSQSRRLVKKEIKNEKKKKIRQ